MLALRISVSKRLSFVKKKSGIERLTGPLERPQACQRLLTQPLVLGECVVA